MYYASIGSFKKLFEILDDNAVKLTLGIKNDLAYWFFHGWTSEINLSIHIYTYTYRHIKSESLEVSLGSSF